jgi:EmrB/QacA subfamily drug resistance transporter
MNNEPSPPVTRPGLVLATCCLSLLMVSMDVTIVNVALPAIRSDLHASVAGLQWSIDGYTVVVASFLLLAGSTGDRLGRRRTFQAGLALFSLGSLLCSLAPTTTALVAFRMLQALGGAMLNPVAMSIIANTFTEQKERARAIGIWGAVFGVSMAIGPLVGGVLTQTIGWRSIFWINVPIGMIAIFMTTRFVPESRAAKARRVDPVAQVLIVVALAALTSSVIDGRRVGWSSPVIVGGFAATALSIAALIAYESRREEPLLDLRFFRSAPFAAATVVAVLAFAGFSGFLFLNSLYLQEARGLSASAAGLSTLPIALGLVVCSPLSGRLVGRGHSRLALVVAGVAVATSALLLTDLRVETPLWRLIVAYGTFGVGLGMVNAPITNTAVSGMPRAQAGLAAAVASTSRQVGTSLGVALAGSIAGAGIASAHSPGFAGSTHPVFWVVVGFGVAIVILGVASTGPRARASAARVAFLLDPPDARTDANAKLGPSPALAAE